MRVPTVHLNGTSRGSLEAMNLKALEAVQAAHAALCQAAPNGRDFYTQHPSAINEASEEHRRRLSALEDIENALTAIILHVQGQ